MTAFLGKNNRDCRKAAIQSERIREKATVVYNHLRRKTAIETEKIIRNFCLRKSTFA
ncbi:hypothetical protein [Bacteroides pyogenes]|uniref:hypothetical protein n=1 Tax=Bacteroides pyogenes TaxID=310300 RepID=UPI0003DDC749|nr:hypothetical protein [Bacteroides pyogenes]MBB3895623.1 hypothetical protein [Bacteroides pyogenes]GAE23543.1 hypothetical protein JCM10003_3333 [Bacteroides pyogenes JCM 10003]SUV34382.1 Uncharacterised protein [Bacteroides pyogenes]